MNWSEKLIELEGKATEGPCHVERLDLDNGDIVYEIWTTEGRLCKFDSKFEAERFVHLRNRAKEIAALVQLVERHACPIRFGSHGADNCVCEYCQSLAALEDEK